MMGRLLLWKPPERSGLVILAIAIAALGVCASGAFALGVPDGGQLGDPEEYLRALFELTGIANWLP